MQRAQCGRFPIMQLACTSLLHQVDLSTNLAQAVKAPVRGDSGASNTPTLLWCKRCTGSMCSLAHLMFMPQIQRVRRIRRSSTARQDAHRTPACVNPTWQLPTAYGVFPLATSMPTTCMAELQRARNICRHAGAHNVPGA